MHVQGHLLTRCVCFDLVGTQATKLFKSQAAGVFFDEMPMRFYGGTPLAYACCFDLRDSVERMLRTGFVTFDDRSDACCITGFLPVHAVCANGLMETYDWMTTQLPEELRATVTERSSVGRQVSLNVHGLWPVQLAAQLGDHASVKHILRKQCSILWIWGPVTQHSMNLLGIDSAGDGGGDIMELVARNDAKRDTCALLLDSFMCGFIHKLFLLKCRSHDLEHSERAGRKLSFVAPTLKIPQPVLVPVTVSLRREIIRL